MDGHSLESTGLPLDRVEQLDGFTVRDRNDERGARPDVREHRGGIGDAGASELLGRAHESNPSPSRSSPFSQRLRLPVRSSRSSDHFVAWMPTKRNGSGGKGSGLDWTNSV